MMQDGSRPRWRTSSPRPIAYWLIGTLLIWLLLPVSVLDMMLAPDWYAPNPQCDSFGIPIAEAAVAGLPFAALAALVSALLTLPPGAWKRRGGTDIFFLNFTGSIRWWLFTLITGAMVAAFAYELANYAWHAAVTQTFTADCAGRAEPVIKVMRGPLLQLGPLINVLIILWLLHVRALAISPTN